MKRARRCGCRRLRRHPVRPDLQPTAHDGLTTLRRARQDQRRLSAGGDRAGQAADFAIDAGHARHPRDNTRPGEAGSQEGQPSMRNDLHQVACGRGLRRPAELSGRRRRRDALQQPGAERHRVGRQGRSGTSRGVAARGHRHRRAPVSRRRLRQRLRLAGRVHGRRRPGDGRRASTRSVLHADGRGRRGGDIGGVLRRAAVGTIVGRRASSCWRPTPTTPTTSGAASACTAVPSKMSFDRPLERGYLRRPAAPDEVAYDGRVTASPTSPTRSTTNCRSTSPTSTTRCGARPAAGTPGSGASSAGPRARA